MDGKKYVNSDTGEIKILDLVDHALEHGRKVAHAHPDCKTAERISAGDDNRAIYLALMAVEAKYLESVAETAENFKPWVAQEKIDELHSIADEIRNEILSFADGSSSASADEV